MSIELNEQQLQDLQKGLAVRVTDLRTNQQLVVLPATLFDRVQHLLYDGGFPTDDEAARLAWEAGVSIGWEDAKMTEYNDYEAHRKKP